MVDCVFCRIVAGAAPARIVATYPSSIALLPLRPAVAGHVLVIPRRHVTGVLGLDRNTAYVLTDAVLDVAARVHAVIHPDGMNVVQSTGAAATQTVHHLHVHVVPRHSGDNLPDIWPPQRDWPAAALDHLAVRLSAAGGAGQRDPATTT